jgi:hypothetical protein
MFDPQKTLAATWTALALSACGEGELLTLGEQRAPNELAGEFVNVQRLDEVRVDGEQDENPTLTDDMREIYFNSDRDGAAEGSDIWYARRNSVDEPFDEPRPVGGWSDEGSDSSPAISGDGLTLWLAWTPEDSEDSDDDSDDDATTDVRSVTRDDTSDDDWQSPSLIEGLNTADDERPRPLGQGGLVMPLSRRVATPDGDTMWRTLLARREGDSEFGEPVLQEQLAGSDVNIVDGFLTRDGLTLVFKYEAPDDSGQLYWSTRASVDLPFVGATPLPGADVNTDEHDERDPWLSPDGTILYFASDREDDTMNIYRAEFVKPDSEP